MMDGNVVKLELTNLANLGSEIELKVKKAAAETESAWLNLSKDLGIQIWRIENFNVVAWPNEKYGSFHEGDSYILLHSFEQESGSGVINYDIHMWVGSSTSQDESGTAAYKTVELDDFLDGVPILYRECQDNESDKFVGLFNKKIRILQGGIASGFKKVPDENNYLHSLFRVKREDQHYRISEVAMKPDSLNANDVFVLDAGLILYKWNGKSASAFQKFKGREICEEFDILRQGKAKTVELEQGEETENFWTLLGGQVDETIVSHDTVKDSNRVNKLMVISDASGELLFTTIAEGSNIVKEMLKPNDIFILDEETKVFIWIGKESSIVEKKLVFPIVLEYLVKTDQPQNKLICCMSEGYERGHFFSYFA